MAFQEFGEHGGGGGSFPYLLHLSNMVCFIEMARCIRDNLDFSGLPTNPRKVLASTFDALAFKPSEPCHLVELTDTSQGRFYGTYAYGRRVPWYEGINHIDRIEKEFGVELPEIRQEHAVAPYMILFDNGSVLPQSSRIAAVISTDEHGNRSFDWKHPTLRGSGFAPGH